MAQPPPDVPVEKRPSGEHPHVIVAPADHWLVQDTASRFLRDFHHSLARFRHAHADGHFFQAGDLQPKIGMEMGSNETINHTGGDRSAVSLHTVSSELADGQSRFSDPIVGLSVDFLLHSQSAGRDSALGAHPVSIINGMTECHRANRVPSASIGWPRLGNRSLIIRFSRAFRCANSLNYIGGALSSPKVSVRRCKKIQEAPLVNCAKSGLYLNGDGLRRIFGSLPYSGCRRHAH